MPALVFIDGNALRAGELRQIFDAVAGGDAAGHAIELKIEALQTGFSTAAPEPGQRARDKVLAHPVSAACFAEAVDLTTVEGKSLRLELDSENETRFCKWWRETPVVMQLVVALRRAAGSEIELFTAQCNGRIANKPAGPHVLGWDRLFLPEDEDATLAQLVEAGEISALRRDAYAAIGRALTA